MKIGIISDIHANSEALETVLEEIDADKLVCAGDLIGYGVEPNKVVKAVQENDIESIKGNHDAKAVHQIQTRMNPSAELALEYNREDLEDENWEYLEDIPESIRKNIGGVDIAVFHGSPEHPLHDYMYESKIDREFLEDNFEEPPDLVVLGHTHVPFKEKVDDTWIVNPGSVGQPRDRNPEASYAVLDTEKMSVELKRTSYDLEKAAEKVEDKLTGRLAERLREGR